MEKVTLRTLLLTFLGSFLLFAGIYMDVMGQQINSDTNSYGLRLNPLVLIGRLVLSIGATMLLAAAILAYRARLWKPKRAPYEITSAEPDLLESQPSSHSAASQSQQQRPQSRQSHQQPSIQMTTYATALGTRSRSPLESSRHREDRYVDSPSSAMLLSRNYSTLGAQNPGYLRTPLESNRNTLGSASLEVHRIGFTPIYPAPSQRPVSSTYSSRSQSPRYSTLPAGQPSDTSGYNWRSHLMKEQRRATPSSPDLDDPPPYESQDIPPPYFP